MSKHPVTVFHDPRWGDYWMGVCNECRPASAIIDTEEKVRAWAAAHEKLGR